MLGICECRKGSIYQSGSLERLRLHTKMSLAELKIDAAELKIDARNSLLLIYHGYKIMHFRHKLMLQDIG